MTASPSGPSSPSRHRELRRWLWRVLGVLGFAAVVAAIVAAMRPKPVLVEVATAERGPMTVEVEEDGHTRVKARYVVAAPLVGYLGRLELEPGDPVKEGQEVARLRPLPAPLLDARSKVQAGARLSGAQANLRRAQAAEAAAKTALEDARRELASQQEMADRGAVSPRELERARTQVRLREDDLAAAKAATRVARFEVETAGAVLRTMGDGGAGGEQMVLRAPVAGVVLSVHDVKEGIVQVGVPLLEIGDPTRLEAVVDVLTTDAVRIGPDAPARLMRWGGGDELRAHVRRVEPKAFTRLSALGVEEQRTNVVLDLDSPHAEWAHLGDGFRLEAAIQIWRGDDVLQVPQSAIFRHGDGWAAFVLQDGHARLRPVEVGQRGAFDAQVVEGLEAGEPVILHPGDRVSDGALVEPRGS